MLTVISIVRLVPDSGQLNCTQWRKLNACDTYKKVDSSSCHRRKVSNFSWSKICCQRIFLFDRNFCQNFIINQRPKPIEPKWFTLRTILSTCFNYFWHKAVILIWNQNKFSHISHAELGFSINKEDSPDEKGPNQIRTLVLLANGHEIFSIAVGVVNLCFFNT